MEELPMGSTDETDEKWRLPALKAVESVERTVAGDEGCCDGSASLFDHGESSSVVGSIERGSIGDGADPEFRVGSVPEWVPVPT
mmetsp:Transcript_3034/g.6084  ORF Transcript_3034/g.6084 Transcript_3034/m.6084 type:complete len:84 (+) Transcript_3034:2946-3197(+)